MQGSQFEPTSSGTQACWTKFALLLICSKYLEQGHDRPGLLSDRFSNSCCACMGRSGVSGTRGDFREEEAAHHFLQSSCTIKNVTVGADSHLAHCTCSQLVSDLQCFTCCMFSICLHKWLCLSPPNRCSWNTEVVLNGGKSTGLGVRPAFSQTLLEKLTYPFQAAVSSPVPWRGGKKCSLPIFISWKNGEG